MAPTKQVEFSTVDGVMLRGNLFVPDKQHAPAMILVVGFTFLKEHFGDIPDRLRDAGYAVLVFDARNWGSSDGMPRHHINLYQQSDDVSDAVSFVRTLKPAVDPDRIGLLGGGHGGGVIMPVAATDPRVKAAVAALPFVSGSWDSKAWPKGHAELLWKEREDRANTHILSSKDPVYVPIFPESLEEAEKDPYSTVIGLPQIVGFQKAVRALSDEAGTQWPNQIHLQSLFHQRRWEPTVFLPQLTIPFLYVTAKKDEFTPHEKHMQAYEKASGPKELLELDSENLEAFGNDNVRGQWMEKMFDFLERNL